VELVEGDVLEVDLAACAAATLARRRERFPAEADGWPAAVRVAGNLPYNISTPLIARLVSFARDTGLVADATLMVQLEVAERLTASPGSGDYGPLSILAQTWGEAAIVLRLPPGAFRPPPKVQSAVVALRFRPARVPVTDVAAFERLVRAVFLQRRKVLSNALQPVATAMGTNADEALARAGIDGRRRPQTLSLAELARLTTALSVG
jgi:16S rRNA (adenine1518-N6/adenine1519-N6)-dimethyltransferase